jgi:hypothetical protein
MASGDIGDALAQAGYENMQIANCLLMSRPKTTVGVGFLRSALQQHTLEVG